MPPGEGAGEAREAVLSVPVPLRLLFRPPAGSGRSSPVLIGMHGYAMDAASLFPLLCRMAPEEFLVVSLQGPHSTFAPGAELGPAAERGFHWGVSARAEENRAVHRAAVSQALRWAVARRGDPARVCLLGFSQPCSLNYRLALDPPHGLPFRAVVALCGGLPGEWHEPAPGTPASRATDVLHVSTDADPFYPAARIASYAGQLTARFRTAAHHVHAGGHRIPSSAVEDVRAFLGERAADRLTSTPDA